MFGLRKSKPVVGLDIGSSCVKAIELKPAGKGKGYVVTAFASQPIPADAIVDGAIIDGGAVATAIRQLFEGRRFATKEVTASLSGNSVIVKKITLPVMTDAELAESIRWEAEQDIPFEIQEVSLDYQILNSETRNDSGGAMDVLLVAAKRDKINEYTSAITSAGRVPALIDVDAFALQNTYEINYGVDPEGVIVLMNAGASSININIVGGEQSLFTRDIPIGGNAYTEAIQRELNVPFDVAERAKKGDPVDGISADEIRPSLQSVTDQMLVDIQKTFDFFKATAASDRIDRILLTGGSSLVDGFVPALEGRFDTPVEVMDPFKHITFDAAKLGVPDLEHVVPTIAIAVGLALETGGAGVIRINLLESTRARGKAAKKPLIPVAHQLTIGCTAILVVTAALIGWRFWTISRDSAVVEKQIAAAQQETARLRSIIEQVQKFEQRRSQLQQRLTLIDQLRKGQIGPVHLLDQISRALPPKVWLTEVKQTENANEVTIEGRCTTVTGLPDFAANLEASGFFKKSVDIVSSQTEVTPALPAGLVKFVIKAQVRPNPGT